MSELNHVKISLVEQLEAISNISNEVGISPEDRIKSKDNLNYVRPFNIMGKYIYVLNNMMDNFKIMGIKGNQYSPSISNYDELIFTLNSILYGDMTVEERTVLLMFVCKRFNGGSLPLYQDINLISSALGAKLIKGSIDLRYSYINNYCIVSLNCLTPAMVETFTELYEDLING